MHSPPVLSHNMTVNGCRILQPGIPQVKDGCSYVAIALFLSYALRRKFAHLFPPHQPAQGLPLVDPYEWQKQLISRGFTATDVRLLLSEAQHFSGVPLRNGRQIKVVDYGLVDRVESDGSLIIAAVCEVLSRYGCMIGVIKIFENYDRTPTLPYLVEEKANYLGLHACVVLGYREVVRGDRLSKKLPPGSYYLIQDSNALTKENTRGLNLVDCRHLIRGHVADIDFPCSGL